MADKYLMNYLPGVMDYRRLKSQFISLQKPESVVSNEQPAYPLRPGLFEAFTGLFKG
jgi:hypothetical protein